MNHVNEPDERRIETSIHVCGNWEDQPSCNNSFDDLLGNSLLTPNQIRWVTRLFKNWIKGDLTTASEMLDEISEEEVMAIGEFAEYVATTMERKECLGALTEMLEPKEVDYEVAVEQKLQSILIIRKAKYDWVEYQSLHNLVCSDLEIDPHDKRVDAAVAEDFFCTATEKLKAGESIKIDLHEYRGLRDFISNLYNSYSLEYANGVVNAKF